MRKPGEFPRRWAASAAALVLVLAAGTVAAAQQARVDLRAAGAPQAGTTSLPPLPKGADATPDGTRLFVVQTDDGSVSAIDIDASSPTFLRELARIPVGGRPVALAVSPDGDDVLVVNVGDSSVSIIDVASLTVRKTLTSPLLDRPVDIVLSAREVGGVAFQSGTYHGYISSLANDELVIYESGPDGVTGIGFDDVIGAVAPSATLVFPVERPDGVAVDPAAPLDGFSHSVGCFVAHETLGHGAVSRIVHTLDPSPGPNVVDTTVIAPFFRGKRFEIVQQYLSSHPGAGLDVALADDQLSVSDPIRVYLSMEGGVVDVFDRDTGVFLRRFQVGQDIPDLDVLLKP